MFPPCLALISFESSPREEQIAVTCAREVLLIASMWAPAAQL